MPTSSSPDHSGFSRSYGDADDHAAVVDLFGAGLNRARQYAALLCESAVDWGLIGPREAPRIWVRHVLNCAVLAPALPQSARVADVGSGAGLPGLVLAIARPDITVSLIEPLLRRATWLQSAVDQLELQNAIVMRSRAEDVPRDARDFDVVTARAVAALPRLLEWCLPLLRPGGVLFALKGDTVAAEIADAEPALRRLWAQAWSVEEFGAGLVDPPTRVARVVAGAGPVVGPGAGPSAGSAPGSASGSASGRRSRNRGRR